MSDHSRGEIELPTRSGGKRWILIGSGRISIPEWLRTLDNRHMAGRVFVATVSGGGSWGSQLTFPTLPLRWRKKVPNRVRIWSCEGEGN